MTREQSLRCETIDGQVGARLRRRREQLGITSEGLGIVLALPSQDVDLYEAGDVRIHAETMITLCKALDVPAAYFSKDLSLS